MLGVDHLFPLIHHHDILEQWPLFHQCAWLGQSTNLHGICGEPLRIGQSVPIPYSSIYLTYVGGGGAGYSKRNRLRFMLPNREWLVEERLLVGPLSLLRPLTLQSVNAASMYLWLVPSSKLAKPAPRSTLIHNLAR